MKGFTENLLSSAAWKQAFVAIGAISLAACGGGGGGGSDSVSVDAPDKASGNSPVATSHAESVQAVASLPAGLSGDGELTYLDAIDRHRGDDNDTPFNAFSIPSNATVVGAVENSDDDKRDYFLVALQAGQWLTLQATEPTAANADFFLYDLNLNLVTAGMGPSALESIQVADSGSYYLEVAYVDQAAVADLVKYRLDVLPQGQAPSGALLAAASYSLDEHIIPGSILVTTQDAQGIVQTQLVKVNVEGTAIHKSEAVGLGNATLKTTSVIASYDSDTAERRSSIQKIATRQAFDTLVQARLFEQFENVIAAEPDQMLHANALSTVNDSDASQQWAAQMIDIESAWAASTGEGVTVAVLDSGYLTNHPDLRGNLQSGYDFIDHDTDVSASTNLELQHGTHVAGVIAATRNNNIDIAGAAPNANLLPLRVLDDCLCGPLSNVIEALRYAAALPNASGSVPDVAAKVANLSLQLPYGRNMALIQTLEEVTQAGTTVVWAAGNDSSRQTYDESGVSGVPGVVIVGSVGSHQKLASYSNYGSAVDLVAPGGDTDAINGGEAVTSLSGSYIESGWQHGTHRLQGTSQAAPFVSSVLALMASVWPSMTPAEIDSLIESGGLTQDIGLAGNDDYYGAGLLDAATAVQTAFAQIGQHETDVESKRVVAAPGEVGFGGAITEVTIDIYASQDRAPNLVLQYAPAWLGVSPCQTDNGYGAWTLTVNRDALGSHNHEDVVRFSNGERVLILPVSAHNPENTSRSTGVASLTMQFKDADTQQVVYQAQALSQVGRHFLMASDVVPPGRYTVQASSDLDADGLYCEAGEICGYLDGDESAVVTISAGLEIRIEVPLTLY